VVRFERLMSFPDLLLADGRRADSLRVSKLFRELSDAGIPGITAEMGKTKLLEVYSAHLKARQPPPKPYNSANSFIEAMNAEAADGKQRATDETQTPSDEFIKAAAANMETVKNSAVRNRVVRMSFPDLRLPDGRQAATLRRRPLYAQLKTIGVPGIAHDMSKIEMLALLDAHVNESIGANT
jgi:hypothetical protein